jgi:hypothetical protein
MKNPDIHVTKLPRRTVRLEITEEPGMCESQDPLYEAGSSNGRSTQRLPMNQPMRRPLLEQTPLPNPSPAPGVCYMELRPLLWTLACDFNAALVVNTKTRRRAATQFKASGAATQFKATVAGTQLEAIVAAGQLKVAPDSDFRGVIRDRSRHGESQPSEGEGSDHRRDCINEFA